MTEQAMRSRILAVLILSSVLAGGLILRAARIQVWGDARLAAMAKRQFQSKVLIRPRRGLILDRNGEALAVNVESHSLAANPGKVQSRKTLGRLIARALDIPYEKVLERLTDKTGKREFVWIKRHLSESDLAHLKKWHVIDGDDDLMPGLWLVKENKRIYPHRELAGHTLGDVNLDSEGLEGVELWADEQLRGKVASVSAVRDALGRPAFIDTSEAHRLKEGENVQLTLDSSLQFSVEQELRNSVIHTGARGGSVIVMNAVNGEVLAMANEPAFDPNDANTPNWRRRNRAVTDGFEPGSTLKTVLLATALSSGHKLQDKIWGEQGSFYVQGKKISEAESHEKFEWISLQRMIQVSSNVVAAKLALRLGSDRYLTALQSFGFGARTGLGFPGEIPGRLLPRKDWTPLTLANVGFGQGLLATPLQIARAYAVFANGGWLVQPTLLKKQSTGIKALGSKRILTQKTTDAVVQALQTVTEVGGTGAKARVDGYNIVGKTGTSQVVEPGTRKYSNIRFIASFVGFALGAEPRVVVFVSLDEPKGTYYAAETAAPLFSRVFKIVANRFSMPTLAKAPNVPEKPPLVSDQLRVALAKVTDPISAAPESEVVWKGTDPETGAVLWLMPPLTGMTLREAMQVFRGKKFEVSAHGNGVIRSQYPEPGKTVHEGAMIHFNLGEP